MAVKLIKACKELNIGMSTAIEYCQTLGKSVAQDPNTRIDDKTYLQLSKKFCQEIYLQLIAAGAVDDEANAESIGNSNSPELTTIEVSRIYRVERICREFHMKMRELVSDLEQRGIHIPMDGNYRLTRKEYDLVREIYLNSPKGQSLQKTEMEDIDKETLKQIWSAHTEVQEQILKLRSKPIKIDPKSIEIIGEKLHVHAVYESHAEEIVNDISKVLQTEIAESDLKNGYILVNPEILEALQDEQKSSILEKAAGSHVGFSFRPMVNGYIKSRTTNVAKFYELLEQLHIKPEVGDDDRMLMTTEELHALKDALKENKQVDVPTQASAIINISPSPIFILAKEFPFVHFEQEFVKTCRRFKNQNGETEHRDMFLHFIVINGGYFKEGIAKRLYEEFGLILDHVKFIFHLTHEAAMSYDWKNNPLGIKKKENQTFCFQRNVVYNKDPFDDESTNSEEKIVEVIQQENDDLEIESPIDEITQQEAENEFEFMYNRLQRNMFKFGIELGRWKKNYNNTFGEDGYSIEVKYVYRYRKSSDGWLTDEIKTDFAGSVRNYLSHANLTVSKYQKSVGIDFDWTEDDLVNIVRNLNEEYPQVRFNIYGEHRCKVDVKVSDLYLKETVDIMKERYEGLEFESDNVNHAIYFYKECDNLEQEMQLRQFLMQETRGLSNDKVDVVIQPIPQGMVKLRLVDDEAARKEENLESIRELKGAEFAIGDKPMGKLVNVQEYPHLVFDISGENFDKTEEILSDFEGEYLQPNLIGDQEKVARLKESLKKISTGKGVQNPALNDFIFDATILRPEPDFDNLLKLKLQDINKNLLNNRINESQKKAIAKSLIAKDLALIQGPPGTGKSTAIAEIIWQHIREDSKCKILLTSETNLAVDNAIAKVLNSHHNLVKPIRIGSNERLESEGRQFALDVLNKWAGISALDHISGTINDEFEIGDDMYEDNEDFSMHNEEDDDFTSEDINEENDTSADKMVVTPERELNALEKWLRNIVNRADSTRMTPETLAKWRQEMDSPEQAIREAVYHTYLRNCNLIGATCSSIGKENIILSQLLSDKYGTESRAYCSFYKIYQQIYGEAKINPISGKQTWSHPSIEFDVVIQDESSKATPAELSLPLIYGHKNIVIGDHRQLPPMLSKESFEQSFDFLITHATDEDERLKLKELKSYVQRNFKKLEISHFERLFHDIPSELKGVFNTQYRMHPAINEVIKQFYRYDGGLSCGLTEIDSNAADNTNMHDPCSRYHGINIPGFISEQDHVLWIDTDTPEMLDGTSRVNYGEVEVIRKILHYMSNSESYHKYLNEWDEKEDKQIGLISFYGKQLRLLKEVGAEVPELPIRISTVDRFQGMERNIVIVSMVRSNSIAYSKDETPNWERYPDYGYLPQESLGFADSPNRLNVALSRAKRLLIIVGNSDHFRKHPIYNNVYQTIKEPYGRIIKANEL